MTAAHLRMPGRATPEEKEQLVDSLIRRLGLGQLCRVAGGRQ